MHNCSTRSHCPAHLGSTMPAKGIRKVPLPKSMFVFQPGVVGCTGLSFCSPFPQLSMSWLAASYRLPTQTSTPRRSTSFACSHSLSGPNTARASLRITPQDLPECGPSPSLASPLWRRLRRTSRGCLMPTPSQRRTWRRTVNILHISRFRASRPSRRVRRTQQKSNLDVRFARASTMAEILFQGSWERQHIGFPFR